MFGLTSMRYESLYNFIFTEWVGVWFEYTTWFRGVSWHDVYFLHYNFLHQSAIFGVVAGLQHAVVKKIIRLLFQVVRNRFHYPLAMGRKKKKQMKPWCWYPFDRMTTKQRRKGLIVSLTKGRPKLASLSVFIGLYANISLTICLWSLAIRFEDCFFPVYI